jgi:serine/threonine protein kinase
MSILKHPERYQTIRLAGQGGTAIVYEARDTQMTNRRIALKLFAEHLLRDELRQRAFLNELRAISALDHPYIVPVYDGGYHEGQPFLVMRWMSGGSLAQKLRKYGALKWSDAIKIFERLATALQYAHKNNTIHRDLKPENILFDESGQAMLADFGIARRAQQVDRQSSLLPGIIGTPAYMAPEVWEGKKAEVPADIYALACLFAEMLLARPLFDGGKQEEIIAQHTLKGPHFPDKWPNDVPAGFAAVLRKALARDPQQRYASVSKFQEALSHLNGRAVSASEGNTSFLSNPIVVSLGATLGGLLALVGLILGAGFLFNPNGSTSPAQNTPNITKLAAQVLKIRGNVTFSQADQGISQIRIEMQLPFGPESRIYALGGGNLVLQLPNQARLELKERSRLTLFDVNQGLTHVVLDSGRAVFEQNASSGALTIQMEQTQLKLPANRFALFCTALDENTHQWRLQCLDGSCPLPDGKLLDVNDVAAFDVNGVAQPKAQPISECGNTPSELTATYVPYRSPTARVQTPNPIASVTLQSTITPLPTKNPAPGWTQESLQRTLNAPVPTVPAGP